MGIPIFFSGSLREEIARNSPGIDRRRLNIPPIESKNERTPNIYEAINFPISNHHEQFSNPCQVVPPELRKRAMEKN